MTRPTPRRTGARLLSFMALALLLASPAGLHAQAVDFETERFTVESIGLSMNLPLGANASTTWQGQMASVQIFPPDSTWIVTVNSDQPREVGISPAAFSDRIIEELDRSTGGQGKAFDRRTEQQIGGRPAEVFYYQLPGVGDAPDSIRAYAIVSTTPRQIVSFILITTQPELARSKVVFEGLLKTAAFADPAAQDAARAIAIANVDDLLALLDDAAFDKVLTNDNDKWQRLYKPAATNLDTDATELGYRRIRSWRGQRGEMDPRRERARWTGADSDTGILIRIESRLLLETEVVDAASVYFLSDDRQREAWKTSMAVKPRSANADQRPVTCTEIGARDAETLRVQTECGGEGRQTISATIPDKGYLSQVETMLIGELLARNADTFDYAFYAYSPARNKILYRAETVDRLEQTGAGVKVTSIHEQGQQPVVTLYSPSGELLSQALDQGRFWEPITLNELYALWKRKGLPID